MLAKVLDTDEGARRLGEVALVPHSSPISQSGLLFYNTLFDENAACHIALGQCYAKTFVDGTKLTPEQIAAQGGNKSFIHIDWMIGSDKIDIDGVLPDGGTVPVFRKGEWAEGPAGRDVDGPTRQPLRGCFPPPTGEGPAAGRGGAPEWGCYSPR